MPPKSWFKNFFENLLGNRQHLQPQGEPVFLFSTLPTVYLHQPPDAIESAVKKLQKLLQAQNIFCEVTGQFDQVTHQAVCQFQTERGLVVDGIVGCLTWSALLYPKLKRGDGGERSPQDKPAVEQIQAFLKEERFPVGRDLKGYFGQGTEKAVKAFQRTYGLKEDGIVGALTMAVLIGLLQRPEDCPQLLHVQPNNLQVLGGIFIPRSMLSSRWQEFVRVACIVIGMQFEFRGQPQVQMGFGLMVWVYAIAISWLVPWLIDHFLPQQRHRAKSLLDLYGPYFLMGILWNQVMNSFSTLILHAR